MAGRRDAPCVVGLRTIRERAVERRLDDACVGAHANEEARF